MVLLAASVTISGAVADAVPVDVADEIAYFILKIRERYVLIFSLPYAMRICLARVHKLMGLFCTYLSLTYIIKKLVKGH